MHKPKTQHPLCIITKAAYFSRSLSRLERLVQKYPEKVEYLNSLSNMQPWNGHLFVRLNRCLFATSGTKDKKEAAGKFNAWLKAQNLLNIMIYTDGLQETNQNNTPMGIGAGWVLNWVGN